jgi:hypothetical protein
MVYVLSKTPGLTKKLWFSNLWLSPEYNWRVHNNGHHSH